MPEERLLCPFNESESVKESEANFDDPRIGKIKKEFNELIDFKSKIRDQKRSLKNRK